MHRLENFYVQDWKTEEIKIKTVSIIGSNRKEK